MTRLEQRGSGFRPERTIFDPLEANLANEWFERMTNDPEMLNKILFDPSHPNRTPTKREAQIAATIFQWLGTNVGHAFLTSALDKAGYKIVEKEGK